MKKLFSFIVIAAVMAVCNANATGVFANANQPQSGTLSITAGTGTTVTNSFFVPYTYAPYVTFSASATNAYPLTNNFVTTTNFSISVTSTNVVIGWSAVPAVSRMQFGVCSNAIGTATNLAFPLPFLTAPVVFASGSSTNATGQVSVSSITTTNVTFNSTIANTIQWQAIGLVAPGNAGVNTLTQ